MYGSSVFRLAKTCSVRYYNNGSTKKLLEFLAEMPKVNTARIVVAQQQRQTISKKSEKYGPSTVYLQALGSGARGVPNTLYLFTDQKRYLFNCGECTQRLAHEHKVKLSRLEHVFITSKSWKNIGGLPGLSLTLQDVGVPKITLHGPDGLDELYNATKRFVIMKEMQVTMAPSSPTEDFEDSVMTVKYVHLWPQVSLLQDVNPKPTKRARLGEVASSVYEQFTHDNTDYYGRGTEPEAEPKKKNERRHQSRSPDHREKKKAGSPPLELKAKHYSVAYICTLKKRLGTLDLAKCVEKGVPPGPLLGQLKSGLDVVLADGTLVLSKDVKTPDDPGPVFIVLEVPDISYLNETEFAAHFDNGTNSPENVPTLIVHMSPPEVFHHKDYKAFIAKFGQSTRHLIVNSQNSCLGSEAVHRTQHKLHLLDPEVFPLLKDPSILAEWSPHPPIPKSSSPTKLKGFEDLKNRIAMAQFQNIMNTESPPKETTQEEGSKLDTYSSRTLTIFHLRPKRQIDRSAEPKLHIQDYYQETMDMDGFVASLEKFRGVANDVRYSKNPGMKEYPKVVFLGTGSCIPSKTRNTSAIIVHVDDQSTILLDCGEGTFGQLVRFYGPRKVDEMLRTLKAIYISHLHADHHIGLIGVLQARAAAFADAPDKNLPLLLLAPGQIATWLTMYDRQFEKISGEFSLVPNQSLMEDAKEPGLTSASLARIGLDAVLTCLVPHCPNAFGVALTAAGHKITYSGDTLPTDNLVKIGQKSAILIHEATMEDELADEARIKMHSTTSQAIEIGRKMNAKYTVLTHFSQRYARLPRLNAHILNDNNTVGIAFDNMQVTLSDLPLLPHMYAPLQLMFAEHCIDMEMKAASRERRREGKTSSSTIASGDETGRRRASRCQSRCGCDSRSSSTTRSLTRKDSGRNDTGGKRATRRRSRGGSRSSSAKRSPTRKESAREEPSKGRVNSTDSSKMAGKPFANRMSSHTAKEKEDSNGQEIANKDRRATPRYKETLTSRLRREHLGTSSTNIEIPRSTSTLGRRWTSSPFTAPSSRCLTPRTPSPESQAPMSHAEETRLRREHLGRSSTNIEIPRSTSTCRRTSSPFTAPSSRRLTPRTPSPESQAPMSHADETTRKPSSVQLSQREQEFLSDVSNRPSRSLITHQSTKAIAYDTRRPEKKTEIAKMNQSSVSKAYVMVNCKDGYGQPLVNSTTDKLIVRKYPTLSFHSHDTNVSTPNLKNPSTGSSKAISGGSFVRITAGLGAASSKIRASSPSRCDIAKQSTSVRFSHIPVIQKPASSVNGSTIKGYKPQLEDIESSYFILTKKQENIKSNGIDSGACEKSLQQHSDRRKKIKDALVKARISFLRRYQPSEENIAPKPGPVREDERRMTLRQAKMKYQSKEYRWYDKIEGLNWISWPQK